jgi:hypothetical protein
MTRVWPLGGCGGATLCFIATGNTTLGDAREAAAPPRQAGKQELQMGLVRLLHVQQI